MHGLCCAETLPIELEFERIKFAMIEAKISRGVAYSVAVSRTVQILVDHDSETRDRWAQFVD
jgi:hypothetical protein